MRFQAVVAARPGERSRPLPARFTALARAITGRADPPRYVSGPATRWGLTAAGAKAVTVGATIHLPGPPQATPDGLGVLAHELAHVTEASSAPRFLLGALPHGADAGERHAHRVGESIRSMAATTLGSAGAGRVLGAPPSAGQVAGLPVAGAGADSLAAARETAQATARETALAAVHEAIAGTAGLGMLPSAGQQPTASPQAGPGQAAAGMSQVAAGNVTRPPSAGRAAYEPGRGGGEGPDRAVGDEEARFQELRERLEEWLLQEIERRGGRYTGVFS